MSGAARPIFLQCGLRVRSEVELHLPVAPGDTFDVDVRWGPEIHNTREPLPGSDLAAYELDDARWYTAASTDSGYQMRFHDCGQFEISANLAEVEIRPDPKGRIEMLPILMAGTVSAFLLALRGNTVLHASAVAIDGATLAFVGQSGRGKSTLATLLCLDGAQLVTDDVLTVTADDAVTCRGGASELRLRQAAADLARSRPDAATRTTADDRLALTAQHASHEALPLACIVIPAPDRTASAVEVRRIPPSTALFALLAFPRVYGWTEPSVLTRDFAVLSQLVNLIPVYDVTIPWGPPFDTSIPGALTELMAYGPPDASGMPVDAPAESP